MPLPDTPTALVERAQRGEREALERLVRAWMPQVLRWCARLSGPGVSPQDAAHEVVLVMMQRLDSLRSAPHFGGWLFGIARRVCAAHTRKAARAPVAEATRDLPDARAGRWPELSATAQLVQRALGALSEDQREVFVLIELEGHTAVEVARLLDLPEGTVRSRLGRGRERFREAARVAMQGAAG